jgi:hypothetical protein
MKVITLTADQKASLAAAKTGLTTATANLRTARAAWLAAVKAVATDPKARINGAQVSDDGNSLVLP